MDNTKKGIADRLATVSRAGPASLVFVEPVAEELAALHERIDELQGRTNDGARVWQSFELPMQPIEMDDKGVVRFKGNAIVRYLLDAGPFDMNHIAALPNITNEERSQFAQLIGYSVSGYGDLSYAVRVDEADENAASVFEHERCKGPVKTGHQCTLPTGHAGMHKVVAVKGVKRCRETHDYNECQLAAGHDGPHQEGDHEWD